MPKLYYRKLEKKIYIELAIIAFSHFRLKQHDLRNDQVYVDRLAAVL